MNILSSLSLPSANDQAVCKYLDREDFGSKLLSGGLRIFGIESANCYAVDATRNLFYSIFVEPTAIEFGLCSLTQEQIDLIFGVGVVPVDHAVSALPSFERRGLKRRLRGASRFEV